MKKILYFVNTIILSIFLIGCNKEINTNTSIDANQIYYHEKTLTYNTTNIDDDFYSNGINLVINKDNQVRSIEITNQEVKTYKNISVGDPVSKIQSSYNYETEIGNTIFVTINENTEIPTDSEKSDDTVYINYVCEDNTIKSIIIYDSQYATKMK